MESIAGDLADSFAPLLGQVSSLSDHDSTSPDFQPLVGTSPADKGENSDMKPAREADSGIGPSISEDHTFSQDILASVPEGDAVVSQADPVHSVSEQSRSDVQPLVGIDQIAGGDSVMGPSIGIGMGAAGDGQQSRSRGVRHGTQRDVVDLTEHLKQMRQDEIRLGTDVQQGQDGILLEETRPMFGIVDNSYRENLEYDRLELLGSGSYSKVHLIRDRQSKAKAVRKCIELKDFSPNEPNNWCHLNHPDIVRFLGLIRTGRMVMYFLEYHEGYQTLQRPVEQCGEEQRSIQIEPKQALYLTYKLFHPLVYLHEKGIVHGDIHEGNILINESLDKLCLKPLQRLKMIDFGESQKITGSVTNDHDDRWDVWCAICILIRLLGGHPSSLDYDKKGHQAVRVPDNTDHSLKDFIQWAINSRPRAVEVLDLIESLLKELGMIPVTGPPTDGYVPPET